MTDSQTTTQPWVAKFSGSSDYEIWEGLHKIATVYSPRIAIPGGNRADLERGLTTASLMAAGNDLLAFAESFLEWAENHADIFVWGRDGDETLSRDEGWQTLEADAKAAIAKARGTS